jgi:multimeric flavodoxin WrbA
MNVVSLLGSPRKKSNSSTLARIISDTLGKRGDTITTHTLNSLTFKGCQGCGACKSTSEKCILKDDLSQVLDDVQQADVLIMATPVYWGEVTAQMKGFIDRTYSYLTPDFMTSDVKHRLPAGKKLVFIQTQGAVENVMFADIFPRYNSFFEQLGFFVESHFIHGCGLNENTDINERGDLIDLARKTARKIIQ